MEGTNLGSPQDRAWKEGAGETEKSGKQFPVQLWLLSFIYSCIFYLEGDVGLMSREPCWL